MAIIVTIARPKAAASAPPKLGLDPSTALIASMMISAFPTRVPRPSVSTVIGRNSRVSSGQSSRLRIAISAVVTSAPSNEGTAMPGSSAASAQKASAVTSHRARMRARTSQ